MKNIKNIIVVSAAKGGVGKSTVAFNLALALKQQNYQVGILDGDIYGPNQAKLFGLNNKKVSTISTGKFLPLINKGILSMSIAYVVNNQQAIIWRGPMASKFFKQMLLQTEWGNLDYLIIDMPPGTGDIQLSLSRELTMAQVVLVSTPQELSQDDLLKAIVMWQKVQINILGIVVNMAYYICDNCEKKHYIFGENNLKQLADKYHLTILENLALSEIISNLNNENIFTNINAKYLATNYNNLANKIIHKLNTEVII